LFLIFDSAAFYFNCSSENYKSSIKEIVESKQIKSLVSVIEKYKQREDVKELLNFVDQRYSGY
jgi:hypothetical protein